MFAQNRYHNGNSDRGSVPEFSPKERDRRWGIARQIMAESDLDALIVCGTREGAFPAPFAFDTYFTNDRPGALVLLPREGEPVSIVFALALNDHMDALERREQVWVRPERMYGGAPRGEALVKVMRKMGYANERFGVLGLDPYPPFYFDGAMPYNTWKAVLDAFPDAAFKRVGERFFELSCVCSEEELAVLNWSARVGEHMCERMLDSTMVGVSEAEIYADAQSVCPRHACFTSELLLTSGKDVIRWGPPSWHYRPQSPRIIEDGDIVAAEVFSSLGMLETQHQPTIAVGNIHPDYERAAEIARASYEEGLAALKPGKTFGQVVAAMQEPLNEAGCHNLHPLIHGMNPFGLVGDFGRGFKSLDGAERYAMAAEVPLIGGDTELQSGMTFSFEPSCMLGRRFVNLGGTVVVGDDAAIELSALTTHLMRT